MWHPLFLLRNQPFLLFYRRKENQRNLLLIIKHDIEGDGFLWLRVSFSSTRSSFFSFLSSQEKAVPTTNEPEAQIEDSTKRVEVIQASLLVLRIERNLTRTRKTGKGIKDAWTTIKGSEKTTRLKIIDSRRVLCPPVDSISSDSRLPGKVSTCITRIEPVSKALLTWEKTKILKIGITWFNENAWDLSPRSIRIRNCMDTTFHHNVYLQDKQYTINTIIASCQSYTYLEDSPV